MQPPETGSDPSTRTVRATATRSLSRSVVVSMIVHGAVFAGALTAGRAVLPLIEEESIPIAIDLRPQPVERSIVQEEEPLGRLEVIAKPFAPVIVHEDAVRPEDWQPPEPSDPPRKPTAPDYATFAPSTRLGSHRIAALGSANGGAGGGHATANPSAGPKVGVGGSAMAEASSAPASPSAVAAQAAGPTTAAYRAGASPSYPRMSQRLGEEGSVVLRIAVAADGRVERVTVERSSGHERLDDAAVEAVESWTFEPATQAGVAVRGEILHTITFRLTDAS